MVGRAGRGGRLEKPAVDVLNYGTGSNINTLDVFFDLNEKDRNLEIYLNDPVNIEKLKEKIQLIFNEEFVYGWSDINSSLFFSFKS